TSETFALSYQRVMPGTLRGLPVSNRRKVEMTSSPHGLYAQGHTRATMGCTKRTESASWWKSHKSPPSSDWRLQLASMKMESLVIADQLRRGECVPEPCTPRRPSNGSREGPKPPHYSGVYARLGDWD